MDRKRDFFLGGGGLLKRVPTLNAGTLHIVADKLSHLLHQCTRMLSQLINIQASSGNLWSCTNGPVCISAKLSNTPVCFLASKSKRCSSRCIQHFMANTGSNISISHIHPNLEMPSEDQSRQSRESPPCRPYLAISSMVSRNDINVL